MIYVYNRNVESFSVMDNNYPIYRGASILGNPYTHLPVKDTKAMFQCKTREEAIEKYDKYFDLMYGRNVEFTKVVDEMYEKYKNGEDLFLECYCKKYSCFEFHDDETICHGDVIKKKLQNMLIKEKYNGYKKNSKRIY